MKAISAIVLAVLILGAVIVSLEMSGGPLPGNEDLRPGQAAHLRISRSIPSGEWMFEATGEKEHAK
jgi:hypothetical protein